MCSRVQLNARLSTMRSRVQSQCTTPIERHHAPNALLQLCCNIKPNGFNLFLYITGKKGKKGESNVNPDRDVVDNGGDDGGDLTITVLGKEGGEASGSGMSPHARTRTLHMHRTPLHAMD